MPRVWCAAAIGKIRSLGFRGLNTLVIFEAVAYRWHHSQRDSQNHSSAARKYMTSVLPVRRVVIGQNAHAAMSAFLQSRRSDLEIRGRVFTDVTEDDLAWADAYIGFKRPSTETMGAVRWVHSTGAGVDPWITPGALTADTVLTRSSESFGPMIAEWALTRALMFSQQLSDLALAQHEHRWAPRDIAMLRGTHALVVGTGDIGTQCGRVFAAMGCKVSGVSRSGEGDRSVFSSMYTSTSLAAVVPTADWLILTLPLTPSTRGLVSETVLRACRGAVLLNAGRGAVVNEAVLPTALDQGWLRGAALDVFETEPLPAASPLWDDPRVVISPHISGLTTINGAAEGFLDCLAMFERGDQPRWIVDRERGY
jgi:phosphoglycerate dehydrogenase-like enzyme